MAMHDITMCISVAGPLSGCFYGSVHFSPAPKGRVPTLFGNSIALAYALTRNDSRMPQAAVLTRGTYIRSGTGNYTNG